MTIDINRLDRALSVFETGEGTLVRKGVHVQSGSYMHMRRAMEQAYDTTPVTPDLHLVWENLRYIDQDLWDLETIFERIDWSRNLWVQDELEDGLWSRFTALDVDLFHITLRSLFDYAAALLRLVSGTPGQIPFTKDDDLDSGGQVSFEKLYNWVRKPGNAKRVSSRFVATIIDCEFFNLTRSIRNAIVHRGGQTLAFYEKPHILFQTLKGRDFKTLLVMPEVMYNDNVVDFELYGGVIYGYLLAFLEDVGSLIFEWLSASDESKEVRSRSTHPGMSIGKRWIEMVRGSA